MCLSQNKIDSWLDRTEIELSPLARDSLERIGERAPWSDTLPFEQLLHSSYFPFFDFRGLWCRLKGLLGPVGDFWSRV
jgi:hypothetical protein